MLGYAHRRTIGAAPSVYPNGWPCRMTAMAPAAALGLVVSASPLILFVPRTHDDLRIVAEGGRVESAVGWDLRYETPSAGRLAHDLLLYAADTGATGAFVRFPNVAPDQVVTLHLYYGRAGLSGPEANPVACWAGAIAVMDLLTGQDRSGQGADLTVAGVTPEVLAGMTAGGYSPAAS